MLVQKGYKVDVYDKENRIGGSCWLIPDARLEKEILQTDLEFIMCLGDISLKLSQEIDDQGVQNLLKKYPAVIMALGKRGTLSKITNPQVFYAGDFINGHTTVVQSVASGKIAAAAVDAYLSKAKYQEPANNLQNADTLPGIIERPISLETDFFGRKISSPFLLSAAPSTDGYENMRKAYERGWAGGIMKTSFDNVPIRIPNEYMFAYDDATYANCDNVSGHPLDRVCKEVSQLIKEFPDRLTMASTGGPVTGNDEADKKVWQSNTVKLEKAGAMAVEYSLSCPQGGDCAEGAIVSQNAKLTAKIIDWVMEISNPEIPKLFKLTSAVTSAYPIVAAVKEVFCKYPNKKAGITLANSFPTLGFRKKGHDGSRWDEGVIAGMAGAGVEHISYLALASVAPLSVTISGNGGPMHYKAAANFLALGVNTVQVCTVVMKQGLGVIDELNSGLSYLLQARGLSSVSELIGRALPNPITDFMALSSVKKVSSVIPGLCEHCGNCTRCPYMAIHLDENKIPQIDPAKCIGCSICVKKCFARALRMRDREAGEENKE
jgi:dihydropyrimidine dehydrogenase (NAD+) subunit PreA